MNFKFLLGCLASLNAVILCPSTFNQRALSSSAPTPHFMQISDAAKKTVENMVQESSLITTENAKKAAIYAAPVVALGLLIKYPAITQYVFDKTIQAANATYKACINSVIYAATEIPNIFRVRQPQDYPAGIVVPQPAAPRNEVIRQARARNDNLKYAACSASLLASMIFLNHFIRQDKSLYSHAKNHGLPGLFPALAQQFGAMGNYAQEIFTPIES